MQVFCGVCFDDVCESRAFISFEVDVFRSEVVDLAAKHLDHEISNLMDKFSHGKDLLIEANEKLLNNVEDLESLKKEKEKKNLSSQLAEVRMNFFVFFMPKGS